MLLEQIECAIVVVVDRLQKTVKAVLVFVFKGFLKSPALVVCRLNRLLLISKFLSVLGVRLNLTFAWT